MRSFTTAIAQTSFALATLTAGCSAGTDSASATPTETTAPPSPTSDAFSAAVVARIPTTASPTAADVLTGRYVYEFSDGPNAAGNDTGVTYTLTLTSSSCRLIAEGYQTDETIVCTTKPIPGGVDVAFKSYGDGKLTDRYDNAVYAVGDPLFSLRRQGGTLLTRWKGYPLPDEKPHPEGVYFTQ